MNNAFAVLVGIMQIFAGVVWFCDGKPFHGILWFLYGAASFVLIKIAAN